ncbi:hypothetical protein AB0H83_41440 [Dactylosporangium sp. NPDC050688]|uniref:hypothetical protein n=1 Tax=Dactylosporangium sp. NPDC050688 TaxID=3157217 RepID=UPI00340DA86C
MLDPEALSRDELITVVRDQAAQLADQAVELERLRAELEQIRRLLSRNSGNSSMPPRWMIFPVGRVSASRPAAGSPAHRNAGGGNSPARRARICPG